MSDHHYILQIETAALGALVTLDGCAVLEVLDGAGRVVQTPATPWILPGKNHLAVFLTAVRDGLSDDPPAFAIALHRVHRRGEPWDGSRVCLFQWTENESALGRWPRAAFEHTFTAGAATGSWDADHTAPYTEQDRPAVLQAVAALNDAFAARDARRIAELSALKWTEIALGLDRPRDDVFTTYFEELNDLLLEEDLRLDPLHPNDLTVSTAAAGHLVHVRRPGGAPAVTGTSAGRPFGFSATLSKRRGTWRLVR
jgi:hypothetical protein